MTDLVAEDARAVHPFSELRDTGLLWLINRVVFHPRGFALALHWDQAANGQNAAVGWSLLGDGSEVWAFDHNEDAKFEAAQEFLRQHTRPLDDEPPSPPDTGKLCCCHTGQDCPECMTGDAGNVRTTRSANETKTGTRRRDGGTTMTETYSDDFLLSLPSIPVPASVTAVAGCSCGGLDWHKQDCDIWAAPPDEAMAALGDARRRLREHCETLNRQLHAALERHGVRSASARKGEGIRP